MAEIQKGIVTQVLAGGESAIMRPYGVGETLTPELPVQHIKIVRPAFDAHGENHPELEWEQLHPELVVGDEVAFVLFEDGTGLIIDKVIPMGG